MSHMRRGSPSSVVPPSIMPVVLLSGSDYQMGFQYGYQAGKYIDRVKDQTWANALARYGHDDIAQMLGRFAKHIQDHVPEADEMIHGVADGADVAGFRVSYTDALLINCDFNLSRLRPPSAARSSRIGTSRLGEHRGLCSQWSAWGSATTNRQHIGCDSGDGVFDFHVAIVAFPRNGCNYITLATAGWLAQKAAINNRGVFVGAGGDFPTRSSDYEYGVPYPCAVQHLLRVADSAERASDVFVSWPCDLNGIHFSDVQGNALVVERTALAAAVRKPGDHGERDFLYSSNSFFSDELRDSIRGSTFVEHGGWVSRESTISSIPRNLEMWNMLHNYHGQVDVEFAKMMWRFPGREPAYPLDYPAVAAYHETLGRDWDQKICNLANAFVGIATPDDGDNGAILVCTGPAGRMAHPMGPVDGRWFQIDGTHSFYRIQLAESPHAVVHAGRESALESIAAAHRLLTRLGESGPVYWVLRDLLSVANNDYYRGNGSSDDGMLASGNRALLLLAQALTYYAQAQARAEQVSNALLPPPCSPEALGLRPYGEAWGDWARWHD